MLIIYSVKVISSFTFSDGDTDIRLRVTDRGDTTTISLIKDPDGLNNATITQLVLDKVNNEISLKKGGDKVEASAEMISKIITVIDTRANQLNQQINEHKKAQNYLVEAENLKTQFTERKDAEEKIDKMIKDL